VQTVYGEHLRIMNRMSPMRDSWASNAAIYEPSSVTGQRAGKIAYVHVPFFFTEDGSALPVVKLNATPVKIIVHTSSRARTVSSTNAPMPKLRTHKLMVDLESEEEKALLMGNPYMCDFANTAFVRFAVSPTSTTGSSVISRLPFTGAVSCLYIVSSTKDDSHTSLDYSVYDSDNDAHVNPFESLSLQIDGTEYFAPQSAHYYTLAIPAQAGAHCLFSDNVAMMPFNLQPMSNRQTGTLSLKPIQNADLVFQLNAFVTVERYVKVFATIRKVIRIGDNSLKTMQ